MFPGFIEPHGHPLIGGLSLSRPLLTYLPTANAYGPPFPGVKTQAAAFALLANYVKQAKSPDETVLAWGYDVVAMGGKHLDKTQLDKVSTTQPILVWDASEHYVYANTAALRKYKITAADAKVNGVKLGEDGEPNGQFLGTTAAASILPGALADSLTPEAARKSTKALMDLSRRNGVTTTSELAYGTVSLAFEEGFIGKYFNDPTTPMRAVVVTDVASLTAAKGEGALAFAQSLPKRNTDKLIFNGVKFFADDSYLSFGMQIADPGYTDGRVGIWITPPEKMVEAMLPWWKAGFQINVHVNGNAGNAAVINALAGLQAVGPRLDHRFTFQHYGISTAENARRIKALGGIVSSNPYYIYYRAELSAPYIGTERADGAAGFKTLIDAGVPVSMHTDTPVAPPNPLEEVWIAVNRFGQSRKVHGAAERVSVDQALRMVTTDAAYTLGVEDKMGSIAPGKFADFTILDTDPYAVPKERIRDIRVWGTVLGGKVYPASEIAP
jgi:predicted amidohydrolase YtcJ